MSSRTKGIAFSRNELYKEVPTKEWETSDYIIGFVSIVLLIVAIVLVMK